MKNKTRKPATGGNAVRTVAVQELRRSGAAGAMADSRTRRARTRGAVKARALGEFR